MKITDDQVAALRAQLEGREEEHRRLLNDLDPDAANVGYVALIGGGFFEAVRRRFIKNGQFVDDAELVDFVASVRGKADELARAIDPTVAETLIKMALGKLPPEAKHGIDGSTSYTTKIMLLSGLIAQAHLSSEELGEFLARTRYLAEEMLS